MAMQQCKMHKTARFLPMTSSGWAVHPAAFGNIPPWGGPTLAAVAVRH